MTPSPPSAELAATAAVALARRAGVSEVLAVAERQRETTLRWRDEALEQTAQAATQQLTLRLGRDGRYLRLVTRDWRPRALQALIADALGTLALLQPGTAAVLAPAAAYAQRTHDDLALADPAYPTLTLAARQGRLAAEATAARAAAGDADVVSRAVWLIDRDTETAFATSQGASGSERGTAFELTAETAVREEGSRTVDDASYARARFWHDLPTPGTVGRTATVQAKARRRAVKGKSGVTTLVVANRATEQLFAYLVRALSSMSLQQGSFLQGRRGQPLASALLTVVDNPWRARGLGSDYFDSATGLASRLLPLIEAGVLANYYLDPATARAEGLAPTRAAPSNLAWAHGSRSAAALIAGVDDGVLVTHFLGGNSNDASGDFSLGAMGFAIRHGELAEPVHEFNVAGNHLTFWRSLAAVGNDPYPYSAWGCPTLVFDGVTLSGA